MSLPGRWVLGGLTATSLLSLALAVTAGLWATIMGAEPTAPAPAVLAIAIYHVAGTAMLLFLFYLPHLLSRSGLDPVGKGLWGLALLFAAPFAMPVYWAIFVLADRERRGDPTVGHARVSELEIGPSHA